MADDSPAWGTRGSSSRAATLSLLLPGLGHWHLRQGGVGLFYLLLLAGSFAAAWAAHGRWRALASSADRASFFLWLAVAVVVWFLSAVDAAIRAERTLVPRHRRPPAWRGKAALLSLLLPGLGQIYSRRFLMGLFLPGALLTMAASPGFALLPFLLLWTINVADAFAHAGHQDVLPSFLTRDFRRSTVQMLYIEFFLLAGFLYCELSAIGLDWPVPAAVNGYLSYWPGYELAALLTTLGIVGWRVRGKVGAFVKQEQNKEFLIVLAVGGLYLPFILIALLGSEWFLAAVVTVIIPRVHQAIREHPDPAHLRREWKGRILRFAASAAIVAAVAIVSSQVAPAYYRHLDQTGGMQLLGLLYFGLLLRAELRAAAGESKAAPQAE